MFARQALVSLAVLALISASRADELLYRYEGDVLPYDESAGWIIADPCDEPCREDLPDGHFLLRWPQAGNLANYHLSIAEPPEEPPPTLWVEWRFRSNHPLGPIFTGCDAWFVVKYGGMLEVLNMYGDAAITISVQFFILDLALDKFHTYRFESVDGAHYNIAVDGEVFVVDAEDNPNGYHYLQLGGLGGCTSDQIADAVNAWDFVRYGTISSGEEIIGADPPEGFLDARRHVGLDRFTVTYDSPNYAYIDEITVEVLPAGEQQIDEAGKLGSDKFPVTRMRQATTPRATIAEARTNQDTTASFDIRNSQFDIRHSSFAIRHSSFDIPQVIATRRLDNGDPEILEVVLDRPIPLAATTRFTFNDGTAVNVVEYTFAEGDADGDGRVTLTDLAAFQRCFAQTNPTGPCAPLDLDDNDQINLTDHSRLAAIFDGP